MTQARSATRAEARPRSLGRGLVLAAPALGLLVTWLLRRRRERAPVPSTERALADGGRTESGTGGEDERDGASAFGGAVTEFSSDPGPAESWNRDWQDEDALIAPEASPKEGDVVAAVPPVSEATPNGDLAGVGDPGAVRALDAVEAKPAPAGANQSDEADKPEDGPVRRV